jgi:hypothetical protein
MARRIRNNLMQRLTARKTRTVYLVNLCINFFFIHMIMIRPFRAEYETCWFICNKNSDSTPPCIWTSTNQGSIFPTFFVHVISVFRKFEVRQRSCSCCGDWLYGSRNWLPFRIPGKLSSPPVFSGVRVTRSLVLCVNTCYFLFNSNAVLYVNFNTKLIINSNWRHKEF